MDGRMRASWRSYVMEALGKKIRGDLVGNGIAFLHKKENNYSVFQIGDLNIKFFTSPYLQRYCYIEHWGNNGYIEYTGIFSTSPEPIKDTIDLGFIAERLHISRDIFAGIKEVRVI